MIARSRGIKVDLEHEVEVGMGLKSIGGELAEYLGLRNFEEYLYYLRVYGENIWEWLPRK